MDVVSRPLSDQCSTVRPADTSITHVVLHYCSNAVLKPQNPYQLRDILHIFESYAVSAHYLIDRKGVIYHLVDEDRVARHAGKGHLAHRARCRDDLNVRSIGIEMMAIGTQTEMRKLVSNFPYSKISEKDIGFTAAQYRSLARLLEDIEDRHGIIHHRKYIVGHDEYAPSRRSDPGSLFEWAKIGLTRSRARTRKQSSPSDDRTGHPSQ